MYESYHQLSFVRASPAPALCRKHPHVPADVPFGNHRVVDGGLHERKADPVIFYSELQGRDGLKNTHHKTMSKPPQHKH